MEVKRSARRGRIWPLNGKAARRFKNIERVIAGALELLPQTMATLAIVPLQTKLVYQIAKERGVEPGRKSIGGFMATAGIGLASRADEGIV